jgi:dTDP-4-dehydrorhamnose reductase
MIKTNDKIVITGCGGMLGEAVYKVFKDVSKAYASDIDCNEPWLEFLDVSVKQDVEDYLEKIQPDYIVHLAAKTDMEYCEKHSDETYATNRDGVTYMVKYANKHSIPLVYVSTAGVFDGEKDAYIESDKPNPLSVYGKSKYEGELEASKANKSIIVRAGWMMGGGPKKDKKFINKIIKQINTGVEKLHVVNDKLGTPCYTYDLARSIHFLLDSEQYGIYHGACDGSCSRYDVAVALVENLGLKDKIYVKKVSSDFFKKSYFAPRPYSEKLLNIELKKIAPHITRDWRVCLKEYIQKFNWIT